MSELLQFKESLIILTTEITWLVVASDFERIRYFQISPLRIQNSGDDKTHRISSSSHALNNINSYSVINNVFPSLATDIAHMPIQPHLDNDTGPPNRLLRSSSTSTCSALYSPLLKVRQNNDLRFQQQKGRYSDTIRYSDSICARYF